MLSLSWIICRSAEDYKDYVQSDRSIRYVERYQVRESKIVKKVIRTFWYS